MKFDSDDGENINKTLHGMKAWKLSLLDDFTLFHLLILQ